MSSMLRRWKLSPLQLWLGFLASLMVGGLVAAAIVFYRGLVVTNLTDLVPWGLWITVDLSAIALSGGAFTLCAGVYLLGLSRFRPLARTATFLGLIGYSMAVMMLLMDIGRPDRFWHPVVFWNPHSVLWEVTMCVMLYMGVLSLETLPLLGEADWFRRRWPELGERLHSVHELAPYLAIAGLGLSMLHQSSLGATYGILQARPVWYRPGLSVLFIVSAIAGGVALTLAVTMIVGRLDEKRRIDDEILEPVARFAGWVLVAYAYARFWDLFAMSYTHQPGRDEALALLTGGRLSFNFWALEVLLGTVLPLILLLRARTRRRFWIRLGALLLVVIGVIAYRWDTTMVGQLVVLSYLPSGASTLYAEYHPSLIEYVTAAGVVAYGALALTLGVRYLDVIRPSRTGEEREVTAAASLAGAGAD